MIARLHDLLLTFIGVPAVSVPVIVALAILHAREMVWWTV